MSKNFGYSINTDKQFDSETADLTLYHKVLSVAPDIKLCISCASCTASCTSNNGMGPKLHEIILHLKRGDRFAIKEELKKCMLCGKCILTCPRRINTRNLIYSIRKIAENV